MIQNKTPSLQQNIDRLVSGELDKPAMREFVEELNTVPDGWRCCALAYMEAQSWRATFGEMLSADPAPISPAVVLPSKRTFAGLKSWTAVAVVIVAAFAAGMGTRDVMSGGGEGATRSDGIATKSVQPKDDNPSPRQPMHVVDKKAKPLVGLVSVSRNGVTESAFAVVGNRDVTAPPPEFGQPLIAEYVRQVWQRKGYAIEQHRKIVSIRLEGGRQFHFPIDWVQYRPVSQQVF